MANILDYLDWRGDLTLKQDPFNEVDNLLLSELSFVDFRGIVPEFTGVTVPLREAAAKAGRGTTAAPAAPAPR